MTINLRLITIAVVLPTAVLIAAEQDRVLTPKDILSLQFPSQVTISADGKSVLYVLQEPDFNTSQFYSHIWTLSIEKPQPRQLTYSDGNEILPAWSPDGKCITFLSDRSYEEPGGTTKKLSQVWKLSAVGEAQQLTDFFNGVTLYRWFPHSNKIICVTEEPIAEEKQKQTRKKEGQKFDSKNATGKKSSYELWIVDLDSHSKYKLCVTNPGLTEIDISYDETLLVYSTNYSGEMNDDQKYDLWLVSIGTGQKRQLTDFEGPEISPRFSPNSGLIAYISQTVPDIEFAQTDLNLIDTEGFISENLTINFDLAVSDPVWSPDGTALYVSVAKGTYTPLYHVTIVEGQCTAFTPDEGIFSDFQFSADGATSVFVREDAYNLPEIYINSENSTEQYSFFTEQLQDFTLGEQRVIRWRNENFEIEGLLILPTDYVEGTAYPLLLFVHGGPYGRFLNRFRQHYMLQVFANQGYVVLAPNPRGSAGYSDKFGQANRYDLGGADFRDLMAGILFVTDSGIADYNRMGIIGGSYGGYLTNWTITQTDRFRAAVSMYGIFNLFTDWGNSIQPLWEKMYFGSYYWENINPYLEHSPAFYAQYIETPVLILHGEEDELTFISNSKEMYQALKTMGKEVEFITYPREAHGLRREPNHIIDKFERILGWFDTYVKSAPNREEAGNRQ